MEKFLTKEVVSNNNTLDYLTDELMRAALLFTKRVRSRA